MKKEKIGLVLTMLIFGSIGLFVKIIPFTSSQIALARGIIGAASLLITSFLLKREINLKAIRANRKWLIASGIAIGLNWVFLFEAYRYTSISVATICYYFAPVLVIFIAPLVLKEKLTKAKGLGISVAMLGMILMTMEGKYVQGQEMGKGILLALIAACLYASVILMNKFLKEIGGIERTIVQLSVAALTILPYTCYKEPLKLGDNHLKDLLLLLIVGILHTGLAYFIYFSVIDKLKSQTVAIYSYIDPISAIIFSVLCLHERMSGYQLIGGILILMATFCVERSENKVNLSEEIKYPIIRGNITCNEEGDIKDECK